MIDIPAIIRAITQRRKTVDRRKFLGETSNLITLKDVIGSLSELHEEIRWLDGVTIDQECSVEIAIFILSDILKRSQ